MYFPCRFSGPGEDGRPRENYTPQEVAVESLWAQDQISSGINFAKYDNIEVKVTGEDKPAAILQFQTSGLATLLLQNIRRANYSVPTPVQRHGLPIIHAGRDLMACAQTGSGKTAAFLLPILHRIIETGADACCGRSSQSPQAVIITPTRELAIQIYDEARKFAHGSGAKAGILYGGTSTGGQADKLRLVSLPMVLPTYSLVLVVCTCGRMEHCMAVA